MSRGDDGAAALSDARTLGSDASLTAGVVGLVASENELWRDVMDQVGVEDRVGASPVCAEKTTIRRLSGCMASASAEADRVTLQQYFGSAFEPVNRDING